MDMDLISIGVMVAIIIVASAWAKTFMASRGLDRHGQRLPGAQPQPQTNAAAEKALATYERLAKEKLEVIKTALTMGYKDDEIARLDARLENLIGKDKLDAIMHGEPAAMASADLLDTELDREIERLRTLRQEGRQ